MFRDDVWRSSEVYRLVNLLQKEGQSASEILDYLPLGIAVVQSDGRIRASNRKYSSLLSGDVLPEDRQLRRTIAQVLEQKVTRENVRVASYIGSILPFDADSALLLIDPKDAAPDQVLIDMLQSMDLPAYLVTPEGIVRAVNSGLTRLIDVRADDLVGLHASEIHGRSALQMNFGEGIRQSSIRTKGGDVLPVAVKVSRLRSHPLEWSVVTICDSAKASPAGQDEVLSTLQNVSGRVAHYMNNWLMIVLTATESLTQQFGSIAALRSDLDSITDASNRAADVCRDLLSFSNGRPAVMVPVSVDDSLTAISPLLRTLAGSRNVTIQTGALNAKVTLASGEFETLLTRLVQNAVTATGADGEITVETAEIAPDYPLHQRLLEEYGLPHNRHLRIRVTDNGIGIPGEQRNRIFEPFFTTRGGAMGLGLSVVHGIVRRARGTVALTSEIGKGSTFDILIPECSSTAERSVA